MLCRGRMVLEEFRQLGPMSADESRKQTHQGHFAAIIFTELTVNVAFSCVEEPMAELNESLWFNFVSLVMPTTST
jgi:hypothetical protein